MIRQVTEAAMGRKRVGERKGKRKSATGRGGRGRRGKEKKGEGRGWGRRRERRC